MNAIDLYDMFVQESESEGIGSDEFDNLDSAEQIIWGKLARRLDTLYAEEPCDCCKARGKDGCADGCRCDELIQARSRE